MNISRGEGFPGVRLGSLVVLLLAGLIGGSALLPSAARAAPAPGWALSALSYPTNFSPTPATSPEVNGTITLQVFNIGSGAAGCTALIVSQENEISNPALRQCRDENSPSSNPITVTDRLPPGVRAVEAGELDSLSFLKVGTGIEPRIKNELWVCTGNGPGSAPKVIGATEVTCVNRAKPLPGEENQLQLIPGGGGSPTLGSQELGIANPVPILGIAVDVQPGAEEHETNSATIAGGGAPTEAETTDPVNVTAERPPYTLTNWTGWLSNADGTIDTQAGSHPYEGVFDFSLATALNSGNHHAEIAGGELRTAEIELPQGFVGDPTAVPQCPRVLFVAEECPGDTLIGTTAAYFPEVRSLAVPVFNLVPPPGVPAEFGFTLQGLNTFLDASVRTGSDYGVNEHVSSVSHKTVSQAITTIWGSPNDPSHARWHKLKAASGGCSYGELVQSGGECSLPFDPLERPFLTLPTNCGTPLPFVLRTTSYTGNTNERTFYMHDQQSEDPLTLTGCESLAFAPNLTITPELSTSDSPTGLSVHLQPTVGGLQQTDGRSSANIRDTTVWLPPGFVVNPGEAANLQACAPAQAALTTPAEMAGGDENTTAPSCPAASKVGIATAKSPLLEAANERELHGSVYLLSSNPPHLKLLAALSGDGINVKLVLSAELDEATGRIRTTVANAPELPISDFVLTFSGGERASVDTPVHCGTYESVATFTPWTAPAGSDFTEEPSIGISAGPFGGACPGAQLPYTPRLEAGTSGTQPGNYTMFSTMLSRPDGDQRIASLRLTTPKGLAAMISNVPECPEPQASTGSCSSASLIGHATVSSGPGPDPLTIPQPGAPAPEIFLTGPYEGAPFGLSIVSHLIAGPFNLGDINTRARIEVDRSTAQVTITTDPLPQIIDGVPTDIRSIGAVIDRPKFMFNPTNCSASKIIGTSGGASVAGASEPATTAPVESDFDLSGCRGLLFTPKLTVDAAAKTSRADGAQLTFKLVYPKVEPGVQANIALAKVDLPKQLPSRQPTLRQACLAATFEANPAKCPAHSIVGHATVHTPVLPVPLTGPAYFVSHGNEAFPSLTLVLQGDGVTIDLVGSTFIKHGVTSNTFKTVPDVPFSSFELTLPKGEFSAVGAFLPASAKSNLCGQKLTMPTEFVAANGLEIHKSVPVAITGCAKKQKAGGKKRRGTKPKRARH